MVVHGIFRWMTVTLAPTDAMDWCNLQFPSTGAIQTGGNLTVYTRGYEPGVTDAGGQGAGITVWVGTSSTNSLILPEADGLAYNVDALNNDEYQAAIGSNLAPGTYDDASRWQLNGFAYSNMVDTQVAAADSGWHYLCEAVSVQDHLQLQVLIVLILLL